MARARSLSAARAVATASLAALMLAFAAGGGGCELAIGDTVPAYACNPGADTCPANAVCVPATHQCIAAGVTCPVTGCKNGMQCDPGTLTCTLVDAASADDGPPADDSTTDTGGGSEADAPLLDTSPRDTGSTGDSVGPCRGLLCSCGGGTDCDSAICADQLSVTTGIWTAAGSHGFCTKPCCTSADCDAATVCFATAAGGNYCVNPLWVGRAVTFGAKVGGTSCGTSGGNSECRSGLCAANACADTCCSTAQASAECATGTTCRFVGSFPGASGIDKNYAATCAPSQGNGGNGSNCNSNGTCRADLCANDLGNVCHDACRSSADCGSTQESCQYVLPTNATPAPVAAACFSTQGNTPEGGSCTSSNTCQSGFCDPTANVCTDVCFANADCTKSGWRCRPEVVPVQGGGSYSVLACGP